MLLNERSPSARRSRDARRPRGALRRHSRPSDHFAARPHRPALVRRKRRLSRSRHAVRQARPLHLRMLYSQGVRLEELGIANGTASRRGRSARRLAQSSPSTGVCSAHPDPPLVRACGVEHFRIEEAAFARKRRRDLRPHRRKAGRAEFRPRACSSASTSRRSPPPRARSTISNVHDMIAQSGWGGKVVTAYRPDSVVDPEFEGFAANLEALGELTARMSSTGRVISRRIARAGPISSSAAPPPPTTATPRP